MTCEDVKRVGRILRAARLNAGLSQVRLRKVLGISQAHVSAVEIGRDKPSPELVLKWAAALGVPPAAVRLEPKALPSRECRCGKEFVPTHWRQKWHSPHCPAELARRTRATRRPGRAGKSPPLARDERIAMVVRRGLPLGAMREQYDFVDGVVGRIEQEHGGGKGREVAEPKRQDTSFGVLLREARQRAGLSQQDVARRLGSSATHVSDVECGRRHRFSHGKILQLAALLDLSPALMLREWALEREDVPLYRTGDEHRDRVAAALSATWATLPPATIERIASAVGL